MMTHQVCLSVMGSCVGVPDLDNIVGSLRTDRESVDLIGIVLDDLLEHGGNGVAHKGGACLGLENAEGIRPAIDVVTVLPERRNIAAHEEEHAITQRVHLESREDLQKVLPGGHGTEACIRGEGPVFAFGGMPVEGPSTTRNWRIKRSCHYGYYC